jgi:hypothetical protein
MQAETSEETQQLHALAARANEYIQGQSWCTQIIATYFGAGVGSILGVFLFQFQPWVKQTDEFLWVVVGDLPSAYLVVDNAPEPVAALEQYCNVMDDWISAARAGQGVETVFPVDAHASEDNAMVLARRLLYIRSELVPLFRSNPECYRGTDLEAKQQQS